MTCPAVDSDSGFTPHYARTLKPRAAARAAKRSRPLMPLRPAHYGIPLPHTTPAGPAAPSLDRTPEQASTDCVAAFEVTEVIRRARLQRWLVECTVRLNRRQPRRLRVQGAYEVVLNRWSRWDLVNGQGSGVIAQGYGPGYDR